jgi:N6-adenosine-specific RNA methylase IME4
METYTSTTTKVRRTLTVLSDSVEMKIELLLDKVWTFQNTIVYTLEIIKNWGFSLGEFVEWKIRRHGMIEPVV